MKTMKTISLNVMIVVYWADCACFCLCHCHCLCLGVFFLSLPIAALHPPSTPSSFLVVLVYPTPPWAPCPLDMRVWLSICSSGLGCVVGACVPSSTLVFLLPCFGALWGFFYAACTKKHSRHIFSTGMGGKSQVGGPKVARRGAAYAPKARH